MLKFSLLGVPVRVHWWFWLTTVLLGGGATAHGPEAWTGVGVWTGVVFVSILVHEFGHALTGRYFGASPVIGLIGFGGVTFLPGVRLTRPQSILVSAAGPGTQLLLAFAILGAALLTSNRPALLNQAMIDGLYVNFFWALLNLLPIQPLDGGQILAQTLGPRRSGITSAIGFIVAVAVCVWALSVRQIFLAMMLAMLAYHNFRRDRVEGGVVTPP
jgi:Zn-dependent protease